MQKHLKGLLLGIAVLAGSQAAGDANATARSMRSHARHHHAIRAVRDYDGLPIVLRPYRSSYEAIPARRAQPYFYLNGEPAFPDRPRGWPRQATAAYVLMSGHW